MYVFLSFCLTVCDNRPGAYCNLGLTGRGSNGGVFLEAQGRASKKFMNCIPAPWLSFPNFTLSLPQKPISGQFQEIALQPYLPLREVLQQIFISAYARRNRNTPLLEQYPQITSPCRVTYATMNCGHRRRHTRRRLPVALHLHRVPKNVQLYHSL